MHAPLVWRTVTVEEIHAETPRTKTIAFDVPDWPGHLAGQHVDVRLTAEDGYQAQRSYSIASAPEDDRVELTVERLEGGEVSPYLTNELRRGDQIELRGPIGGYFTWHPGQGGPLLLAGGGSGVVPLMSMIRHHASAGSNADVRLLVSARSVEDLLYRDELEQLNSAVTANITLTRTAPPGWEGFSRRVDAEMLEAVGPAPAERPQAFVCGPTAFVETVADLLVGMGHEPANVHTERFGPTGG